MTSKDQQPAPYYEPKPAPVSNAQKSENNPYKFTLDYLSLYLSLFALVILLFVTAYYYGFLH
ncbi:MAG: hypothetical protein PUP92_06530 [Rhizonema sp. PD38]|nr:hypothetical protein [Rhizonema sp. PD38]